jgi:hypothetical protein
MGANGMAAEIKGKGVALTKRHPSAVSREAGKPKEVAGQLL